MFMLAPMATRHRCKSAGTWRQKARFKRSRTHGKVLVKRCEWPVRRLNRQCRRALHADR
jgi:hypothetical protein